MPRKNGKSAEQFNGREISKVSPTNSQMFVYNETTGGFELKDVIPVLGSNASGLTLSQDNSGVERHFFKDDFTNDTLANYSQSGSPAITGGELVLDYNDGVSHVLPLNCTTGLWGGIFKINTSFVSTRQYVNFNCASNVQVQLSRFTGNAMNGRVYLGGVQVIHVSSLGTLADSTYAAIALGYDGTTYTLYYNGVSVGTYASSTLPTSPCIGVSPGADTPITLVEAWNELTYSPSVAYTEPFTSDTETRYMQLSSTDLSTWAASAAGDVVVTTGSTKITLSSDDDRGIAATFRSYLFGSGEYEFAFDNNNDGGGGADTCCGRFAVQDINNYYKVCVEDDAAGAELLKFYKVVAGTATQLGSTKDVSATYTRGNKTWIKVHWDAERGQMWAYLRDNAGTYPTTPDISDAFSAQFSYGKFGNAATVTTAGPGNLNVDFFQWTVRAKLLIGETNAPATESSFYWRSDFNSDEAGRWTNDYGDSTTTYGGAGGRLTFVGGSINQNFKSIKTFKTSSASSTTTISTIINCVNTTAESKSGGFAFEWDGRLAGNEPYNGYLVAGAWNTERLYLFKYVNGVSSDISGGTISVALNDNTDHTFSITKTSAGLITVSVDGVTKISVTDTTFSSGYFGYRTSQNAANNNWSFDNLTISGTRYYMKPMLRGAQIGEYWDGAQSVACTRFCDDFNWDTSAEYANITGSGTWDTANGIVSFGGAVSKGANYVSALQVSSQVIVAQIQVTNTGNYWAISFQDTSSTSMATTNGTKYIVYGASATTFKLSKVIAGAETVIQTINYAPAVNTPFTIKIERVGTTINVYMDAALLYTTTDSSITGYGYTRFGIQGITSGTVKYSRFTINALESTSTNGIAVMIGGVPHGARYDMQEEAYTTFTNKIRNGEFFLQSTALTTYPTGQNFEYYFANTTDSTAINWDGQTIATLTAGTTWTDGVARALIRYQDFNDTIKLSARRKNYSGVVYDNQPAVFVNSIRLTPVWGVV